MPTFRERFGDEAADEMQGYASGLGRLLADIGQGAGDVAGAGLRDAQNVYWNQIMGGGRPPSPTPLTGDMETTTGPKEPAPPSFNAALRKYAASEGAEHEAEHWRQYATRDTSAPDIEPAVNGWERYSATFHGAGAASSPSATPQPEQEQGHEPEL